MQLTRLHTLILTSTLSVLTAVSAGAAETDFCGRPSGEPAELEAEISKAAGVKEIHRGPEYVAFQDEKTEAVFTFTQAAQGPAHPAAVCRLPVRDGDNLILKMTIVCRGAIDACQSLESDFKLLNAQMEAAIRNEAGQSTEKK